MTEAAAPPITAGLSRMMLIGAAVIAVTAIGYRIMGDKGSEVPAAAAPADPAKAPDINSAIATLEARLQKDPKNAEGWRMLGIAFSQTGKFAEAASALKRSTQLAPAKADTWALLGATLMNGGDGSMNADAKAAFDKALALDPRESLARYYRGIGKDMAGDHAGALADWFDMLEQAPPDAEWRADYMAAINNVAKANKIDVSKRLAALPAIPAKATAPGRGAVVAAQAIPGPSRQEMQQAASMPKGQQDAMIQGMVESLAAKLKANPKNLDGWIMLMRSRVTLGETAKAGQALKDAKAAFTGDAAALGQIDDAARALGIGG